MTAEPRPSFLSAAQLPRLLMLVPGVLVLRGLMVVFAGGLEADIDPDIWLRLMIVENLYQGGGWYDHGIARSNTPHGSSNHWSRALDILLLAPAAVLAWLMPFREALLLVAPWVNWLALALALPALLGIVQRCGGGAAAQLFVLLAALVYVPFSVTYAPSDIDLHPWLGTALLWQINLAMAATGNTAKHPTPARMALWLGVVGGLGVWMSVEYVLSAAGLLCWAALLWLRDRNSPVFSRAAFATAFTLALAFLLEQPPQEWLQVEHDALSIVQLALFTAAAVAAVALYVARQRLATPMQRFLALGGAALSIAVFMQLCFPGFYLGPIAATSPEMREIFLPFVIEMQPLFHALHWKEALAALFGLVALPYLLLCLRREADSIIQARLALLVAGLLLYTGLMVFQMRWNVYTGGLHVAALALWVNGLARNAAARGAVRGMLYGGLALLLAPVLLNALPTATPPAHRAAMYSDCSAALRAAIRQDYFSTPPRRTTETQALNILAHGNYGGYLLFWTPHRILASNYHREREGYVDLQRFIHAPDDATAHHILRSRQVDIVAFCPLAEGERGAYFDRLFHHPAPPWLAEVVEHPWHEKGLRLFLFSPQEE